MPTRRHATELDRLLDRLVAGGEPEATGDLAPFLHPARVARATLVRRVPEGVAREHLAAFRADRARNVVVSIAPPRRAGLRAARLAVIAAVVVVLGCGSAVAASARALPGDAFYGVKRATERISLWMERDPADKARKHLEFAGVRLDEIQALRAAGLDVTDTVGALEEELEGAEQDALHAQALGQDAEALLAHVQEMISKHIAVLERVLGKVGSEQAEEAIQRAIDRAKEHEAKVQRGRSGERGKPDDAGKPTSNPGKGGNAPGR